MKITILRGQTETVVSADNIEEVKKEFKAELAKVLSDKPENE